MDQIMNQLQEGLVVIVGMLISIGVIYAVIVLQRVKDKLMKQANAIENEEQRKLLTNSIEDMHRVLTSSIVRVDATLKPAILEGIKDGKLDKSELVGLSDIVMQDVVANLKNESLEIISNNVGDVQLYIQGELEKELAKLKIENVIPNVNLGSDEELAKALATIEELKKQLKAK